MWQSPHPEQEFTLCAADGTVLAELPPVTRLDSAVGKPDPPKPPAPRPAAGGNSSDVAGTETTEVVETSTIDPYTWERAPFSAFWFPLGDGLPRERPAPPSTVTTKTTTNGKTVTQTVAKGVVVDGTTQTSTTRTTTETVLTSGSKPRYVATAPYWGAVPPAPLLQTDDLQAAYMAAYQWGLQNRADAWVMEWTGSAYNTLEQMAAPPPPQIVLVGEWEYDTADEALAHAAEIEKACQTATQLAYRGRVVAALAPGTLHGYTYKTADVLRHITHTLTLYTTEYFTAREFARRQLR